VIEETLINGVILIFSNPLYSCNDYEKIPAIDLNLWKEIGQSQQNYVPGFEVDYKKK